MNIKDLIGSAAVLGAGFTGRPSTVNNTIKGFEAGSAASYPDQLKKAAGALVKQGIKDPEGILAVAAQFRVDPKDLLGVLQAFSNFRRQQRSDQQTEAGDAFTGDIREALTGGPMNKYSPERETMVDDIMQPQGVMGGQKQLVSDALGAGPLGLPTAQSASELLGLGKLGGEEEDKTTLDMYKQTPEGVVQIKARQKDVQGAIAQGFKPGTLKPKKETAEKPDKGLTLNTMDKMAGGEVGPLASEFLSKRVRYYSQSMSTGEAQARAREEFAELNELPHSGFWNSDSEKKQIKAKIDEIEQNGVNRVMSLRLLYEMLGYDHKDVVDIIGDPDVPSKAQLEKILGYVRSGMQPQRAIERVIPSFERAGKIPQQKEQ